MILKPCPFCHKDIPRSITACPYCHRDEQGKPVVMDSAAAEMVISEREIQEDLKALASEDPYSRNQAVHRVAQRGPAIVPALLSALTDFSKPGLAGVAKCLGKIGDKRAIDGLAQAAKIGDEDLRMASVWALTQIHDPEVMPHLLREAERPHPVLQSYLAHTLGALQDAKSIPVLSRLATNSSREVAFQAALALGESKSTASVTALKMAWRKGDPLVRAASTAALKRLGSRPSRFSAVQLLSSGLALAALGAGLSYFFYR